MPPPQYPKTSDPQAAVGSKCSRRRPRVEVGEQPGSECWGVRWKGIIELAEPKRVRTGLSEGWAPRTLNTSGKLEAKSPSGVRAIWSYPLHRTQRTSAGSCARPLSSKPARYCMVCPKELEAKPMRAPQFSPGFQTCPYQEHGARGSSGNLSRVLTILEGRAEPGFLGAPD